jgi:hypothetical protein
MNLKQSLSKYELALIPIILSLFLGLYPGFESVKAQSELGCEASHSQCIIYSE